MNGPEYSTGAPFERNPSSSTMIPSIGYTFSAAAKRIATTLQENRQDPSADRYFDYTDLEDALLAATPRTPSDVLAVLDRLLCPEIGLVGEGHRHAPALQKVRDALGALFGAGPAPSTSTIIPALGLTFRDAVDRCLDLIAQQNSTPTDTEEGEAQADALADQWLGMKAQILIAQPVTPADGVAIADFLLNETTGFDVAWAGADRIGALSRVRDLLNRQAAPLPARAEAGNPDAALLALGREFETAWENERRLAGMADMEEEWTVASEVTAALVDRIVIMPAATLEGLKVKARALLSCGYKLDEFGPEMFTDISPTADFRAIGSIIQDLMSMGGKA